MSLPRSIAQSDRKRILAELAQWSSATQKAAARTSFQRLRTRAMVFAAWGSGMRLNELCALNLAQVLEHPQSRSLAIRSEVYVTIHQAKGRKKGARKWSSAGRVLLTKRARIALRDYLADAVRRGWLELPAKPTQALFIGTHGWQDGGHVRISRRTAQHAWRELQTHAGIPPAQQYHFHCLRHDACTRFAEACNGDLFKVATFGRFDPRTAQRYVHSSPAKVAEFAELAAR